MSQSGCGSNGSGQMDLTRFAMSKTNTVKELKK